MEQVTETETQRAAEKPRIRWARTVPDDGTVYVCAEHGCPGSEHFYEVRLGTRADSGQVQVLCQRHYRLLWWGERTENSAATT